MYLLAHEFQHSLQFHQPEDDLPEDVEVDADNVAHAALWAWRRQLRRWEVLEDFVGYIKALGKHVPGFGRPRRIDPAPVFKVCPPRNCGGLRKPRTTTGGGVHVLISTDCSQAPREGRADGGESYRLWISGCTF